MRRWVTAVAVGLLAVPAGVAAQDSTWNRYTLAGLSGLFVQIESDEVCQGAGIDATTFEASTSLQLIEGEVPVLTQMEMLEHPAHPELLVSLSCVGGSGQVMAYAVGLRVMQAAQMLRDTQITLPEAVTWHTDTLGVTNAGGLPEALGATLTEALGGLVEAWAKANAEEEGGGA